MDFEKMSRDEIIDYVRELNEYIDNIVVFWGRSEFHDTFQDVAKNAEGEYTEEESRNAAIILDTQGAFDEFLQLLKDSFEKGGISYLVSERISALMQDVADRHRSKN
jgi:hypothetical protein